MSDGGKLDEAKGRAKQAAGDLKVKDVVNPDRD
jgi:uncharacterized protein YjbJ (UPF0337 family)